MTTSDKPDEHMDAAATCIFFGGSKKPIDLSTLYRGMREGRYPRPIDVGGARWLRSECEETLRLMIERRDAKFRNRRYVNEAPETMSQP